MTSSLTRSPAASMAALVSSLVLGSLLTACGGGGSDTATSATPASADPAAAQSLAVTDPSATAANAATDAAANAVPAGTFRGTLVLTSSGNCADVTQSSLADTARLQEWQCNGTTAQSFDFKPVAGQPGAYYIVNVNSGKCVSNYRFDIAQQTCPTGANPQLLQMWTLRPVDAAANQYLIVRTRDIGSGQERCITGTGAGARLLDNICNTTPGTQTWRVTGSAV